MHGPASEEIHMPAVGFKKRNLKESLEFSRVKLRADFI
jgi:hypothetical protein